MTRSEYLQDQIARAERLAKHALDQLTIDRLRRFSGECREELTKLVAASGVTARPGYEFSI